MGSDQDLDRRRLKAEIAEALAGGQAPPGAGTGGEAAASFRRPLLGHDSQETAYLVADYPYGFRQRTQIRYWLEHKPKKGRRTMRHAGKTREIWRAFPHVSPRGES